MTHEERKTLTKVLFQSTTALYGLYEAIESLTDGADRSLLHSQKMALERIIERNFLYFVAGGDTDATK